MKRSSSTEYEKEFQKNLFEMVLDGKGKEEVLNWINQEKNKIKELSIKKISFPCKIANKEYKNNS